MSSTPILARLRFGRRLPTNRQDWCRALTELFDVSAKDRAEGALKHIARISDLSELRRIKNSVQERIEALRMEFLAKAMGVMRE